MLNRRWAGVITVAFLTAALILPLWLSWRKARQDRLDRELITEIRRGDAPAALHALNAGADPNAQESAGMTPVMYAVDPEAGDRMLRLMIARGANLRIRNRDGRTALGLADHHRRSAPFRILQAAGAAE